MSRVSPAADNQAKQARAFTCATCHRDEAQFQPRTPMGIGLQLPPDQTILITHPKLTFESRGFSYVIERHGDQSTYTVSAGGDSLTLPIRYAFGVHMQTFVLEREGHFYESLVSYYPAVGGLALTMGDERIEPHNLVEAMGRETSNVEITRCFGCHSTNAVTAAQLHLDTMKPGLACEVCHTGANAHMQALADGKPSTPPRKLGDMAAEDTSEFCGQCHRTWSSVVQMRIFGIVNARFQPYRLANSRCFLGNDKRIACTGCHNPHHDLVRDDNAYDGKCLACHAATVAMKTTPVAKQCPVAKDKCVSCHMPKVELPGSHSTFTDHYIRIVRAGETYPN
jgi:hypothetical protein